MELDKQQEKAAGIIDGQVLVVACPGSGKTTIIIERCKRMVEAGIDPKSMLNITFTKAAADEMAARFRKVSGSDVQFSTIHAFCFYVLRMEYGYTYDNLLKESQKYTFVMKEVGKHVAAEDVQNITKNIVSEISFIKNKQISAAEFSKYSCRRDIFTDIYNLYEKYKLTSSKIDFDDMLIICRDKFKSDPTTLKKMQDRFKYITIDEYQDTNTIQAEIFYMLSGGNGNIYVVGDDDQSIYAFRAADSQIMLDFPKHFPKCKKIELSMNYRSGSNIVKFASKLIGNNKVRFDKDFHAGRKDDGNVTTIGFGNNMEMVEATVNNIIEAHTKGMAYENMAVLYRINSLATPYTVKLLDKGVPFYVTDMPQSIHSSVIYRDILSYYRLSRGKGQNNDLMDIINRPLRYLKSKSFKGCEPTMEAMHGIIRKTIEYGWRADAAMDKVTDMFRDLRTLAKIDEPEKFLTYLFHNMKYMDALKSYAEWHGIEEEDLHTICADLMDECRRFMSMEEWFAYAQKYENDMIEKIRSKKKEGVCLSTFHGAKGREWDTVFVVNADEEIAPYKKASEGSEMEEERRMFYVAETRAKNNLYVFGSGKTESSRFVRESSC